MHRRATTWSLLDISSRSRIGMVLPWPPRTSCRSSPFPELEESQALKTDRRARRLARDGVRLAIGLLLPVVIGCGAESANGATRSSRITREILADRFAMGRLAGATAWRACARADSVAGFNCPPPSSSREFNHLAAASRAARQRLDSDSSVDALREAALLSLRLRDSVKTGLDEAARLLARARRVAPKNPTILNDFAVVQLELGERDQTVRPYLSCVGRDRAIARRRFFVDGDVVQSRVGARTPSFARDRATCVGAISERRARPLRGEERRRSTSHFSGAS